MNKFLGRIVIWSKSGLPSSQDRKASAKIVDAIEWALLLLVFASVLFLTFSHNGFIDASDIQPYPY